MSNWSSIGPMFLMTKLLNLVNYNACFVNLGKQRAFLLHAIAANVRYL